MKASETKLQRMLEGTQQYVVPLFQRPYSWDKKEWDDLWTDLLELCEEEQPRTHFIGSMVTMPTTSVPEGVAKYLLIDGQQRLTTIFILLVLLRDKAKEISGSNLSDQINDRFLLNKYEADGDYYKLMPTQVDRKPFQDIIMSRFTESRDQIVNAYNFFEKKLRQFKHDLQVLCKVITSNLLVVSIVLDHDDNPYLVFESLNAKGKPLTQSDLIRNYFFMRIHVTKQEDIYANYWLPMQLTLDESLTEFIRHFLMKDGFVVKQDNVYLMLKERAVKKNNDETLEYLKEIVRFSTYYTKILVPEKEPNKNIRRSLSRLNCLGVTTAYPFLLNCYNELDLGMLSEEYFTEILKVIENFMVRRFVCNVPTNQLNKIFPTLYIQAKKYDSNNLLNGVKKALQTKGYPKDAQFQERLTDVKLYGSAERADKAKLILSSLEESFGHKEQINFDTLSIEHVMPQTLSQWWQEHLGDEWEETHELFLHSLGNLTLTGYNPELSNSDFYFKRKLFCESHLKLNEYFATVERWDRDAIEGRSAVTADMALKVWPYFGDDSDKQVKDGFTGTKPTKLQILGQEFEVKSWRDVMEQLLNTIADLEPEKFLEIIKNFPHFIGSDESRFHSVRQLNNGVYMEVNRSANVINRFCIQAAETIGLTSEDWNVESA